MLSCPSPCFPIAVCSLEKHPPTTMPKCCNRYHRKSTPNVSPGSTLYGNVTGLQANFDENPGKLRCPPTPEAQRHSSCNHRLYTIFALVLGTAAEMQQTICGTTRHDTGSAIEDRPSSPRHHRAVVHVIGRKDPDICCDLSTDETVSKKPHPHRNNMYGYPPYFRYRGIINHLF